MAWYMFQGELPPRAVSRCKFDDLLDAALEPADSRSGLHTARRLHGVLHVPGRVASKSCTASSPSYLPSGLWRSLSFWCCCWCTRGSRSLMVRRRRDGLVVQFLSSSSSSVWSGGWWARLFVQLALFHLFNYLLHQLLLQGFLCMQSRLGDCLEKGGWVINWLSINVMIIYVTAVSLK
jgi:hypothetical protein